MAVTPYQKAYVRKRCLEKESYNWPNHPINRKIIKKPETKSVEQFARPSETFFMSHLKDSHGDVKGTWKIINGLLGKKSKNAMINNLKVNGETLTDAVR